MANGNKIGGLLASPGFSTGIGLLGAGLSQPRNLGQGLLTGLQAGGQIQSRALENQAGRRALQQQARQRGAQEKIVGLLGRGGQVEPGTGAVSQGPTRQELMGLLAEANPQQFTQGLLGQMFPEGRRPNSLIEQARFAFPDDPNQQREFVREQARQSGAPGEQVDRLLDMVRLQQAQQELESAQDERRAQALQAENSIRSGVARLDEIIRTNERIAAASERVPLRPNEIGQAATGGNLAQRGLLETLTRVGGFSEQEATQVLSDAQRFNQLTSTQALESLANSPGLGQGTNAKLQAVFRTKPGFNQTPSVNNQIAADALEELLNKAEQEGITIEQRERLQRRIDDLRGNDQPESEQPARGERTRGQGSQKDLGDGFKARVVE